jgi:aryl-alcohol dehydrogenase-like predicted oxidoreductase
MNINQYAKLGSTELLVSPICLGTMSFGEDWGSGPNVGECHKVMGRYISRGGNFIDTANVYAMGAAEEIIGDYFRKNQGLREQTVLSTKFFGSTYTGEPTAGGTARTSIIAACDNSLKRLKTDFIDLYWLHQWDQLRQIQETMSVLNDLVQRGKIRYIGFSDVTCSTIIEAQMLAEFRKLAPVMAIQSEYSLLERSIEQDHLPVAQELGLAVMTYSALKQGVLSGKYTRSNGSSEIKEWLKPILTEGTYDLIDRLEYIARTHDTSVSSVALAWVRQKASPTSTIVHGRQCSKLDDHINSLSLQLTDDEMHQLDVLSSLELQRKSPSHLKPVATSVDFTRSNEVAFGVVPTRFNCRTAPLEIAI